MNTGPDNQGGANATRASDKKQKKKRNWVRWTIFGTCVFLAIFALFVSIVPEYAARQVMRGELAKIGIETTGTETLYLNPWRGEVRLGPVEFWSEGAERGQIGTVGAKMSLATLFKKRALIETFILEEIELIIEKRDDGIFVNGVSLQQFMTAEQEPAAAVEEEAEEEAQAGWGAGIDKFEFRDSTMILKNFIEGDELEIAIDHLFLTLFHTWAPDEPGVVSLLGSLAGAPLFFDATAQPFADDIKFQFTAGIENLPIAVALDYGRVAQVLDREIFTRRDGVGATTLSFAGFLFQDGRIEMNGQQKATFEGLHLVTPEDLSVEVESATLSLRSAESYVPDGRIEAAGEITSTVEGLQLRTKEGQVVRLESVLTKAENFFFEMNPDKSIFVAAAHTSKVKGLHVKPDPNTAVDLDAVAFGIEKLNVDQSPEGKVSVSSVIKIKMEELGAQSGPDTRATIETASVDTGEVAFERAPDGPMRVSLTPQLKLTSTRLQGPAEASVDHISVALSSLIAEMAGDAVSVQTAGATDMASVKLTAPGVDGEPGPDVSVEAVRVDLRNLAANMAGGDTEISGAVGSEISGLTAIAPQPAGAMTVAADQLQTSLPTFTARMSGADIKLDGEVGSQIAGLSARIPQDGGEMTVAAERVETSLSNLNAEVSGDATSVALAGTTNVTGFETGMPGVAGRPEINVGLGSLDVAMKEIAASVAGEAAQWKVTADMAVKKVATRLKTAESVSTVDVASVNVTGVDTDQALDVAIGAIVVAGIDADLVDKDLKAFGGDGGESNPSAQGSSPKAAEPTVELGRLAVGDGSTVQYTDTSVDPPVIVVVDLDDVEIKNIDTGDPGKRTDLKVKATINESSELGVAGWATPLKPTPDFDLDVNLNALPLPAYSSYVSDAIGWHLDGGDLSTTVNASAQGNALDGQVGVVVDNLFLNPVSAADGEKLEKQIGVPVQFAVGILKDDQGRIDLTLPLSGTLENPEVDYSSVIQKAISGFLGSIFGSDSFQGADGFKLQPVVFAPGSAVLDEAGKKGAEMYVTMLEKKPALKVGVCGRANVQDFVALFGSKALPPAQIRQTSAGAVPAGQPAAASPQGISSAQAKALVELAMERTNVVRGYLVDEKGINSERIVQCRVSYDIMDTQPPRAQFAM